MERKTQSQSAKDFVLDLAELSSSFFQDGASLDITDVVTDIDIYEHLDKPYVTGTVTFVDSSRIYEFTNFYGIEKFTMRVKLPEASFPTIEKVFYVDKVVKNIRTNDGQAIIVIHVIEKIGYLSELQNINRSYYGKGYRIISNIVNEYLGVQLSKPRNADPTYEDNQDAQPEFGLVVPNLRPLKAAEWIKDRLTTAEASPFYFFSTFIGDKLHLLPLSKMLENNPLNAGTQPFRYSQAYTNKENLTIEDQAYIIEGHDNPINEEILKINGKGFLNTVFGFHDVTRNITLWPGHQPGSAPGKNRWTAYDMFQQRAVQGRALGRSVDINQVYPVDAKLPLKGTDNTEELLHLRPASKVVTNIYSTEIYENGIHTLAESRSQGEFLSRLDARGLRNWLVSAPINFTVPGRTFLLGNAHTTIGNKYNLVFLTNSAHENVEAASVRDTKKSGEYLMYAARHAFTREGYTVHLTGVKIVDESDASSDYTPPIPNEVEPVVTRTAPTPTVSSTGPTSRGGRRRAGPSGQPAPSAAPPTIPPTNRPF